MVLTVTQERMDRIKLSAAPFARRFGMASSFKEAVLVQMKFEGTIAAGDTGLGGARDALKYLFGDDSVILWGQHHLRARYGASEVDPFFEVSSELQYNGLWQGRIMHDNLYMRGFTVVVGAAYAHFTPNSLYANQHYAGLDFPVEEDDYVQMNLGLNENTGAQTLASRSDMNFLYLEK